MPNPNLPIAGNFNTYVGARYVPVFAEPMEWSANSQYEPLTIVTYNGNSYTSKTFPPVGTVPTNDTYWAQTGNYDAQIEQYRQETQAVKEELDNIQADVSAIQNNKKIFPNVAITIADSYGTEYTKDGRGVTPWTELLPTLLPDFTFLGNFSQSGAGLGAGTDGDIYTSFTTLANNAVAGISANLRPTVTHIICSGGSNDIRYDNTLIRQGLNRFVLALRAGFPNAQIWFFCPNVILTGTASWNTLTGRVYPVYTQAMPLYGISLVTDVWKCIYSGYFLASDLSHPNTSGQEAISRTIATYLVGGELMMREYERHVFAGDISGTSWISKEGINLEITSSQINFSSPITLNNSWVKIGECEEAFTFDLNYKNFFVLNVGVKTSTSPETWKFTNCQFYIKKTITGVNDNDVGIFTNEIYCRLNNELTESGASASYECYTLSVFNKYVKLPFVN